MYHLTADSEVVFFSIVYEYYNRVNPIRDSTQNS